MVTFKGNYDKSKFYSFMGKFFGERKYKRMMPYLYNDDNVIWHIEIEKNEVVGFIGYVEKSAKINIVYCFVEDEYLNKNKLENRLLLKVVNEFKEKNIFVEIEKNFNKEVYIKNGFEVYKESKNYWYLKRSGEIEKNI